MKHMGIVEDRQITPFITYIYLPTNTKYVDFPFGINPSIFSAGSPANSSIADYQQKRYYSDECPMKWKNFNALTKGKYNESQIK